MSLDIDLNGIKSGVESAYQTASTSLGKLGGRLAKWIHSGTQSALPYLKDKEIAAFALIGVTILLTDIAFTVHNFCKTRWPLFEDSLAIPMIIIGCGVAGFVGYAQMTLTPLAIITISVATSILRAKLTNFTP